MTPSVSSLRMRLGNDRDEGDELFIDLLCEAENYVLGYTGRSELPDTLNGVVVELAAISYNRLGIEGENEHSEGDVRMSIDSLPERLKLLLDRYRLARVV